MKLYFTDAPQELLVGIRELCADLDVSLYEEGMKVAVTQRDGAELAVRAHNGEAFITYDRKIHFFRAFSLLVQHLRSSETDFCVREKPQFALNGPMFDVSQGNAVIKVSEIKKTLRNLAQMGLDMLMLYCEDSFDVKAQPYFGYMRARYSESDIRECDDYADLFGIEMIPCIQTLAHLVDVLKWHVYDDIRENDVCLLVGEEKTYQFIRDLLTEATRPFRSKRVHIGMDEAYNLGRGAFLDKYGFTQPQEIMKMHLERVLAIVRELGLRPMMWSDMFFSGYGYYSDAEIPQELVNCCPKDVQLVYWDYYHNDEKSYVTSIARHRKFGEPIFAGGIWTWIGYGPHWNRTFRSTEAALNVCKREGIREVFVTIWGDNGTECLYNTNVLGLALYAEHGYSEKIDYEKLKSRFEFITGARYDDFLSLEGLDDTPGVDDTAMTSYNPSKFLMWQDILTGLCDKNIDGLPLDAYYADLAERLKPCCERNGAYNDMFRLYYLVADTLAKKSEMGLRITKAYRAGDREELARITELELPDLSRRMTVLRACHRENWFALYKSLGWDVMDMRYGSLLARIDSASYELGRYLDGDMEKLEELGEERLDYDGKPGMISYLNWFGRTVSASRIAPYC
ncbi:MAG: beta-N-acetylhexosaminidase [Clostridiaceae bacterium]|nr:beta-N-acetylhexosaminidase [Clostridiaceae bacterium]